MQRMLRFFLVWAVLMAVSGCDVRKQEPTQSSRAAERTSDVIVSLKTNDDQHYIVAEDGGGKEDEYVGMWLSRRPTGLARADRTAPGPWEMFRLRTNHDTGEVGFQAENGAWLSAQPDGTLVFNRHRDPDFHPEAWEGFRIEPGPSDCHPWNCISIVTFHGTRVRALYQGGGKLIHERNESPGLDEAFYPSTQLGSGPVVNRGQLQLDGAGFFDSTGRQKPILCHFGDALSRYVRHPDEVRAILDDIQRAGFDGIRFWTTLGLDDHGGGYWAGREVGPTYTGNYWQHLVDFLRELKARGLYAQISQGDTRSVAIPSRSEFFSRLAQAITVVGPEVAGVVEFGNESWQTGELDANEAARRMVEFKSQMSIPLLILSSGPEESKEDIDRWSRSPADLWNFHDYRGGNWWDKIRHTFSLRYEVNPLLPFGWSGEGPGYGDLVSASQNKHELDRDWYMLYAAMTLMTRRGYVYFTGPGVKTGAGERLQDMPAFWEVAKVRDWFPSDIMDYDQLYHGGDRWADRRVFAAISELGRADHAQRGSQRCAILYGPDFGHIPQVRGGHITHDNTAGNKGRVVCGSFN